MCTSPVECWSVRLVVHVCLQNQTGRCCPSKWMILSSWNFHWIVYWPGNKSREWVLEATESQPPIEGQEGLWFMVLLSKRFMLAIYHINVDIYIYMYISDKGCFAIFQTLLLPSSSPFQRFKTFFLFSTNICCLFCQIAFVKWEMEVIYQVAGRSSICFYI